MSVSYEAVQCVVCQCGPEHRCTVFCRVPLSSVCCCYWSVLCAVREVSYIINIKFEIMTAINVLHLSPYSITIFPPYHIDEFVAIGHEFRNSIEV